MNQMGKPGGKPGSILFVTSVLLQSDLVNSGSDGLQILAYLPSHQCMLGRRNRIIHPGQKEGKKKMFFFTCKVEF